MTTNPTDPNVFSNMIWISNQLKLRGPRLEENYEDALNKIFNTLRNFLINDEINSDMRMLLLHLLESRANRWA